MIYFITFLAVGFKAHTPVDSPQVALNDNNLGEHGEKYYTTYDTANSIKSFTHNLNWSSMQQKEHQTYAGYLKKQGALFKQWKERYFVLDSMKHQLRYYDHANDLVAKGVIDLSDIEAINQGMSSTQNHSNHSNNQQLSNLAAAKKALNTINAVTGASLGENNDWKCCFELKTSKRVYCFAAPTPQEAQKWIKQLEMCCTDS
jgi:hypothetical protein